MVTNAWRTEDKQRYDTLLEKPLNSLTREELGWIIDIARSHGEYDKATLYLTQKIYNFLRG